MIRRTIGKICIFLFLYLSFYAAYAQSITVNTTTLNFTTKIAVGSTSIGNFKIYASGLVANLDINSASSVFQISLSAAGPWSTNLSLVPSGGAVAYTTIYVRFVPVVAGNASSSINCTSSGATTRTVNVSGFGLAAAPTSSSCILTAVANPSTPGSAINFTFSAGDGNGRVLVLRQGGSQPDVLPVNGIAYLSLTDWVAAASTINELSASKLIRVVYVGNATSTTVTGLSPSTQYTARVVEFNNGGVSGAENYLFGGGCTVKIATTGTSGTYTWTGATSNDFSVATNWNPNRTSPTAADILQFTSSPSGTITGLTTQTIGQLFISGSTNVDIQASSTATVTIGGIASSSTCLDIAAGCSLTVSGSNVINIALSKNAIINGVVSIRDANHGISSAGSFTYGTNSEIIYYGNVPMNISPIQYGNLTIHSSANSNVTAPAGTLLINSRFKGSSFFAHNNGTVNFNGGVQTISGTNTFNNVTLSGNSGKTITSGAANIQTIRGTLTISSSAVTLATNGNVILYSDASITGRIAALPASNLISGNITVQRYIPGGPRNSIFHLSAPVNGATVSQWQPTQYNGSGQPTNGFYITGIFTGASNPGYGIGSTGVSMYGYDAANGVYGNYPMSSNTDPLTPGVGYRVSIRDGSAAYFSGLYCAKTISVTGTPNMGTFSYSLSYNPNGGTNPIGGWNLLGNPYASDITADLTNGGWNTVSANLSSNDVYIWSSVANNFVSCNSGSGNCTIPSSQGFWVRTTVAGGTFQSSESVKVSGSTTIYREANSNLFNIKLTSDQYSGYDEAYLRFANDATSKFDAQYDAIEPFNLYGEGEYGLGIYSVSDENSLSINTLPEVEEVDTVKLFVKAPAGNALVEFSDIDQVDPSLNVYLLDNATGQIIDLRQVSVYPFTATADNTEYGANRFDLIVARSSVSVNNVSSINLIAYPNPAENTSEIILNSDAISDSEVDIIISDNTGRVVYTDKATVSGGKLKYTIKPSALPSGIYAVACKGSSQYLVTKLVVR